MPDLSFLEGLGDRIVNLLTEELNRPWVNKPVAITGELMIP